jgi:hypothetical protein
MTNSYLKISGKIRKCSKNPANYSINFIMELHKIIRVKNEQFVSLFLVFILLKEKLIQGFNLPEINSG